MLCQSSKDQEPPPTPAIGTCADTLYPDSQRIEITCSNYARFDCADGFEPSINKEDEGKDDAPSENPLGDLEWDDGFDLSTPAVEE